MTIHNQSEIAQLSIHAAKKRRRTMESTIKQHDKVLVRWISAKFGDAEIAKDIAQSVYVRVLKFAETSEIENPKALLFKTAANLAANEFRSRSRARQIGLRGDTLADDLDTVACDRPDPERHMSARSELETSLQAIEQLPDKLKTAFKLSRFEEKNYREIAEIMNVSESSVEKYIIKSLRFLRASLAQKNAQLHSKDSEQKHLRDAKIVKADKILFTDE